MKTTFAQLDEIAKARGLAPIELVLYESSETPGAGTPLNRISLAEGGVVMKISSGDLTVKLNDRFLRVQPSSLDDKSKDELLAQLGNEDYGEETFKESLRNGLKDKSQEIFWVRCNEINKVILDSTSKPDAKSHIIALFTEFQSGQKNYAENNKNKFDIIDVQAQMEIQKLLPDEVSKSMLASIKGWRKANIGQGK